MNCKKKIVLFSSSYPYGLTETFLHNEVDYLKDHFDIEIYPMLKKNSRDLPRKLPDNVTYFTPFLKRPYFLRALFGLFNFAPVIPFVCDFFKMVKKSNNIKKGFIDWFLFTISYRAMLGSRKFRNLFNSNDEAIYYFYWGNFPFHLLPNATKKIYIRVHGGEVNFERHFYYIPMAKEKFCREKSLILPISEDALSKLIHINSKVQYKLSRLGVKYCGNNPPIDNPGRDPITVVSCSNLIEIKRVGLIVDALSKINNIEINWVHFGDGPLFLSLKEEAKGLPSNITVELKGRIPNEDVLRFYMTQPLDLFINVSETEGVPVSIMEALSFGIPCFATDVGGTGEILDKTGGMLVEKDFDITILANFISNIRALNKKFNLRDGAKALWAKKCVREKNYEELNITFSGGGLP